jgi:hypothetical protein
MESRTKGDETMRLIEKLFEIPPVKKAKSPLVAALLGFWLSGIGLGLYLRSWRDGVFPILGLIVLSRVFPGSGTILAMALTSIWGFLRACDSLV